MAAQAGRIQVRHAAGMAPSGREGQNVKAVRALLDMDALRESKDQTADIKAALDALAESDGYLFDAAPADEGGTGITASTGGEHGDGREAGAQEFGRGPQDANGGRRGVTPIKI